MLLAAAPCAAIPDFDFEVPEAAPKKTKAVKRTADDVFVDLDLSSAREVVPATLAFEAEKFAKPTVTISEGENLRTVSKNCMLTAAEYFAARQLMKDATQKVALRENGTAAGGTVVVDKYTAEHCRNMYVPKHLVARQNLSDLAELVIPGELHVAGVYDIAGGGTGNASDLIKAKRVKLYPGGSIVASADVVLKADRIESTVGGEPQPRSDTAPLPPGSSEYELKKVETELVKADDEFIPSEGTEASVEIGVFRQSRESCQPKQ